MKILMILFFVITAVWLYLFISWIECMVKGHRANKREDVDQMMKYSIKSTQLSLWICVLALIMNVVNLTMHLIS